jgi:hypothetical protein
MTGPRYHQSLGATFRTLPGDVQITMELFFPLPGVILVDSTSGLSRLGEKLHKREKGLLRPQV